MKNLIISILLISMFFVSEAQKLTMLKIDTVTTVKNFELQVVKECLWNYQKQRQITYILSATGTLTCLAGIYFKNGDSFFPEFYIAGGALFLAGLINMVDADKWLRRAGITPTPGGIAIRLPRKK
jgi:hypothetical protein